MAKAKAKVDTILEIEPMRVGTLDLWLKGDTPLICNRMAAKAMRELLLPKGRKTKADKEQMLKHDPMNEFRNSMSVRSGTGPTRVVFPSPAIKGSMATAALETKGTSKAQIGRLVRVKNYSVDLYGIPEVFMAVVRCADQNKTPDVRTRAIFKEWCMKVSIQFVTPQLNETSIVQILSNGGIIIGLGDFRQEKGKGDFGCYHIAEKSECDPIIKSGGMKQQDAAIEDPQCFDADTEELLAWFYEEVKVRGKDELVATSGNGQH